MNARARNCELVVRGFCQGWWARGLLALAGTPAAQSEVVVAWPPSLANATPAAPTFNSYEHFGRQGRVYNVSGPAAYYSGLDLCAEDLDPVAVAGRVIFSDLKVENLCAATCVTGQ